MPQDEPTTYPSLWDQAKSVTAAVGRVADAVVHGRKVLRNQDEQDACMAICRSCEKFDAIQERCTICGCYGDVKSRLITEECPLGKWPAS